jgi:hypothetical protein
MGESLAVWDGDETGNGESSACISSVFVASLQKFKSLHFARIQKIYLCFKDKPVIYNYYLFDACNTKLDHGPS